MKGLLKLLIVGLVLAGAARWALQSVANNMVDSAVEAARDSGPEEALKQLDEVERWFSWTEAAARIPEERRAIERRLEEKKNLDDAQQWSRELDERWEKEREEADREQRQAEERERMLKDAAARDRPGG